MSLEALKKELLGSVGANAEQQAVTHFLDTGYPPLNKIISGRFDGGLPYGRIIEMFGPSSSGKTAIATQAMIAAQKAGGIAIFMDHERSFDVTMARKQGLSEEFPLWIYRQPRTWEQSNTEAVRIASKIRQSKAIADDAPIIVVYDSVAAMVPRSVLEKEMDEYNMNDTTALARATSTTLKAMALHVQDYNMICLYLNQIRMKPGVVYGDPTTTPGGGAMEYFASVRISLGRKKMNDKTTKEFLGQIITCKTAKNKIIKPFQETQWQFKFREDGSGYFDGVSSLIDYMTETKILTQSGARITWTDGKTYYPSQLAAKIESEGLHSELYGLLPKDEAA